MDDKFPPRIPQEKLEELVRTGQIIRITTFDDHMRPDVTWIEPTEFSRAFDEIIGEVKMDFGDAVRALKAGHKVARDGWNGKGMHLELQVPDENSKMSLPYIFMFTVTGDRVPWLASQTDVLSEDWSYVNAST